MIPRAIVWAIALATAAGAAAQDVGPPWGEMTGDSDVAEVVRRAGLETGAWPLVAQVDISFPPDGVAEVLVADCLPGGCSHEILAWNGVAWRRVAVFRASELAGIVKPAADDDRQVVRTAGLEWVLEDGELVPAAARLGSATPAVKATREDIAAAGYGQAETGLGRTAGGWRYDLLTDVGGRRRVVHVVDPAVCAFDYCPLAVLDGNGRRVAHTVAGIDVRWSAAHGAVVMKDPAGGWSWMRIMP